MDDSSIIELRDVSVYLIGYRSQKRILHNLNFKIRKNAITGFIGESGSGKTIASLAILKLLPFDLNWKIEGKILFDNGKQVDLLKLNNQELRKIRRKEIGMIFQEPSSSLNPILKVSKQVGEALESEGMPIPEIKAQIVNLFEEIDLDIDLMNRYPHQLSGGQIQRVMIAMALIKKPKILIADEPTTALDSITQYQFLKFLQKVKEKFKISILFISHDLKLVEKISEDIIIIDKGRIIDYGSSHQIFYESSNSITKKLVEQSNYFNNLYLKKIKSECRELYAYRKEIIKLENIEVKILETKGWFKRKEYNLIRSVNLSVFEGENVGIIGRSGAGKTTVGRCILKLIKTSNGKIEILGKDLQLLPEKELTRLRVNFQAVFQSPMNSLNPLLSVGEAIAEVLLVHKLANKSNVHKAVEKILWQVGLSNEFQSRLPHQISTGQRQRVLLAKALCLKPKILICDEPFASLDINTKIEVFELFQKVKDELKLTIIFISHDFELVKAICDRVVIMDEGQIIDQGITSEIFENPQSKMAKNLFQKMGNNKLYS